VGQVPTTSTSSYAGVCFAYTDKEPCRKQKHQETATTHPVHFLLCQTHSQESFRAQANTREHLMINIYTHSTAVVINATIHWASVYSTASMEQPAP